MDLFYPELLVQAGPYCFTKGIRVKVCSCQDSYYDWAKLTFTQQFPDAIVLPRLTQAKVYLGYDGSYSPVFEGYVVSDFAQSDSINEVLLQDATIKLEAASVSNVFLDAQPGEVVTYCCQQAGLPCRVSPTQYPQKTYSVMGDTALKAIQGIGQGWSIAPRFFVQDGSFCWDMSPEQTELYKFSQTRNIISLAKDNGYWVLETVSVPFIRHSQKIAINHPRISGTFEVYKMVFESNDAGFIRTQIYFKG